MEGAHPDTLRTESNNLIHSLTHLPGCLVRKCDRQDIPWVHTYLIDQPGNPVCKDTCLTGSCSGKDQKRALCIENGLLLSVI